MVIDDVFAVVAEGTRREILGALRTGDKSVGTLVEELEVSQPTVSKHLKVLREAGLVSMRAEGQRRYYSLQTAPLEEILLWLTALGLPSPTASRQNPAELAPVAAGAAAGTARPGRALFPGRVPPAPAPAAPEQSAAAAAAAALAPGEVESVPAVPDPALQNRSRTVGRAAERAAGLFGQLPKFRRRQP